MNKYMNKSENELSFKQKNKIMKNKKVIINLQEHSFSRLTTETDIF